jgi:hypothetical protein
VFSAESESLFPAVRVPSQVHDGGDDYCVLLHGVKQPIGKSARSTPPMFLGHPSPSLRVEKNPAHGSLDFIEEF